MAAVMQKKPGSQPRVAAPVDPSSAIYLTTESRLIEWGAACRGSSDALGYPIISSFTRMAEQVKAGGRERRKKKDDESAEVTARGKESRSFRSSPVLMNSRVAHVDAAVARLPNWMQKCIKRTYMYSQPDRIAADEMRMSQGEYAQRRRAAVCRLCELME